MSMTTHSLHVQFAFGGMFLSLLALPAAAATSGAGRGAQLYENHCVVCHESTVSTHAPSREALSNLPPERIVHALEPGGLMEQPGRALNLDERRELAAYLSAKPFGLVESTGRTAASCKREPELNSASASRPSWNGWGVDAGNKRFQSTASAHLTAKDVPHLSLQWTFVIPDATSSRAQPAVVGGRLFVGSSVHTVYSLDAKKGCVEWTFDTAANVRSGIVAEKAVETGPLLLFFGDESARVYALDAHTGQQVWQTRIATDAAAGITGTVKVVHGMVLVPLMTRNDTFAAIATYECCTARGALISLDAATGRELWRSETISEPAAKVGINKRGVAMWGPSGASAWSSPTVDEKLDVVYVTTGDNHSQPATLTSDAILAFDIKSGRQLWSRQFTSSDAFNAGCLAADDANCPSPPGPDQDFGAPAVLLQLPGGRRLLIAGQKTGMVHAVDPDNKGEVVWETRASGGGLLGGIEWGLASDQKTIYVPISDLELIRRPPAVGSLIELAPDAHHGGGLLALDVRSGRQLWKAPPIPCPPDRPACSPAQLAATTVIPGVVFSGSLGGYVRAYSTATGDTLWEFDTNQAFTSVGGLVGHGGAVNGPGPVVADGMVYVTSGWDNVGLAHGNVILAFGL
jgi:polyvinyl alcohol dehydrogenase (cytochrome)